jgi:hypothetical protein
MAPTPTPTPTTASSHSHCEAVPTFRPATNGPGLIDMPFQHLPGGTGENREQYWQRRCPVQRSKKSPSNFSTKASPCIEFRVVWLGELSGGLAGTAKCGEGSWATRAKD